MLEWPSLWRLRRAAHLVLDLAPTTYAARMAVRDAGFGPCPRLSIDRHHAAADDLLRLARHHSRARAALESAIDERGDWYWRDERGDGNWDPLEDVDDQDDDREDGDLR